ncbi:MAG TPA: metallophosphoesterase [Candidatus Hydrogenedentes bacterium]|nr:metallophosphoesterase [Candidatus Hydrogenedentota bacterium]
MRETKSIAIVSDIHFASDAEKLRRGHEARAIDNRLLRLLTTAYRRYFWLRDPFAHNHLLDRFILAARDSDLVVANGDYSCDTAFVGVSDDAAYASARICLSKLRAAFPERFQAVIGDHEFGKMSLFGGQGGLRLASWLRSVDSLALDPLWRLDLGRWVLVGVASSLVALPVFEPETLPEERATWQCLREQHIGAIRDLFRGVDANQRVVLFCHDPTALPFLWREGVVRSRIGQVRLTVIGHLHTRLVCWQSRVLAGMPRISFLGNSIRRMTEALRQARCWRPFRVRLCPSLAGCELLKDGGYGKIEIDPDAEELLSFRIHRMRRS